MDDDAEADGIAFPEAELPEACEFVLGRGTLGPADLSWLGQELRGYYDSILREPVPERLLALLDQGLARRTSL
jgi:hypothetical protein